MACALLRLSNGMQSFSRWVLHVFASPIGVIVLAALDSTLFFSLPFGIDAVVIVLSARFAERAWIVPLLATAGSVAGAALTFWMGVKIGEAGLERHVSAKRLERIRERLRNSGAIAFGALDLIPPPFPFTPFVLAAGALEVDRRVFFITLAVCRMIRFALEALLAVIYGRSIVHFLESDTVLEIVLGFTILAVGLTALSIYKLAQSTRTKAVQTQP